MPAAAAAAVAVVAALHQLVVTCAPQVREEDDTYLWDGGTPPSINK